MEDRPVATLHAPSKTFLMGEYLALSGGPAILLNTEPRFTLRVFRSEECRLTGIAAESPAGKLLRNNGFPAYSFEFTDPHEGRGGFGASSAQFALCYRFLHPGSLHAGDVLDAYQDCAWAGAGHPPSGADVLSQLFGNGISLIHQQRAVSLAWPFADLGILLVRTGRKVATHEHLAGLNLRKTDALYDLVEDGWRSLAQKQAEPFLAAVRGFREELAKNDWIAPQTRELLNEVDSWPGIAAAKGCGALGADVLLIVHETARRAEVEKNLHRMNLPVVASAANLFSGNETRI